MIDLQKEEAQLVAQGGHVGSTFSGAANVEPVEALQKGDKFTLPNVEDFKVFNQPVTGTTQMYQYLWVEVTDSKGKISRKQISGNTFGRIVRLYDEVGNQTTDSDECRGTASDEYRKHPTKQEAMASLAGKSFIVKDAWQAKTRSYNEQPYREVWLYDIDIA